MIHGLLDLYRTLTTPEKLIQLLGTVLSGGVGYLLLFGIVYSETGLLVGFFLPGDSFLFTVGVVAGAGALNIFQVNLILMAAALLGDSTGYFLGRKTGPKIFSRKDSRLFKQAYVTRTHSYYERYGGKTIIIARFVPIVRTFAAFMAGVGQMPYLKFLPFSICGGVGWVFVMTMLGYTLGSVPIVKQHFEKVVFLIIVVSLVPTVVELYRARRGH
jgi:membrane-associated protein